MAKAVKKTTKAATPAVETKVEAVVEVKEEVKETPVVEVKEEAKKAPAKKAATKKAAVKEEVKEEAKKAPAKKAALKANVTLQFAEKSYTEESLVTIAKDVWKFDLNQKATDLKSVELYVKPEEGLCYYVFNGDITGNFVI